jgi:hypothetical protein
MAKMLLPRSATLEILAPLLEPSSEELLSSSRAIEIFVAALASCMPVSESISTAQIILDDPLGTGAVREDARPPAKFDAFKFGEDWKQMRVLESVATQS